MTAKGRNDYGPEAGLAKGTKDGGSRKRTKRASRLFLLEARFTRRRYDNLRPDNR
jgi:hypothetical protein